MRLKQAALLALRGLDRPAKERIASALEVSLPSVYRFIQDNDDNLTKAAALKVIREETGLSDSEILEEDTEVVSVETIGDTK